MTEQCPLDDRDLCPLDGCPCIPADPIVTLRLVPKLPEPEDAS
jgi:hypothetical protein